jgi:methionyl-tRNA formyltransferase
MNIVFFGSDSFSLPFLEYLYKNFNISLVITTKDKIGGRGLKLIETPTKVFAKENNIPFIEVSKMKENIEDIKKFNGEIGVIVSFGKIIPNSIIEIFPKGIINLHPSLLPKYRGPNPIRWQILNGEKESGVTIMKLTNEVDAGPILLQKKLKIDEKDNYTKLSEKLIEIGKECLNQSLELIKNGRDLWIEQKGEATYAPKFDENFEKLDFNLNGDYLKRKILCLSYEPGGYAIFREKRVKILDCYLIDVNIDGNPGEIVFVKKDSFGIKTKDKILVPEILKIEGKKIMNAKDFINGYKPITGEKFY